jgi:hypothetical protein
MLLLNAFYNSLLAAFSFCIAFRRCLLGLASSAPGEPGNIFMLQLLFTHRTLHIGIYSKSCHAVFLGISALRHLPRRRRMQGR